MLFGRALAEAEQRHQHQDAWWVQVQRGLALRDDEVLVQAGAMARRYGLKAGYEAIRP